MRFAAGLRAIGGLVVIVAVIANGQVAWAQSQAPRVTLPPVIVTAQKEPRDLAELPVSVTAVTLSTLFDSGARIVSDVAPLSPNTFFTEFTARKSSNPRFRGLGASPSNPAVTTYYDGVPQLNVNSSSIELLHVSQIEFVRGPQSPLYGRNALGGIINVTSVRPSMAGWTGDLIAPFGNASAREVRGNVSGPIGEQFGVGFAIGTQVRDGFTVNDVTGNDLDSRDATFGKAQLLWTPSANWEARVIFNAERDRDGDYALADLDLARSQPFRVQRDFEGYTHRDVASTAITVRGEGERFTFTSSTGFVGWKTEDATDLDYSPLPLATRNNQEEDFQFTQELRAASGVNAPVTLSDGLSLTWQAGMMFFTQAYEQVAVNNLSPFVLSPLIGFPVSQYSPDSELDDFGIGLFGQATLTVHDKLDLTGGARYDYEDKEALLDTFFVPAIAPPSPVSGQRSYSNVSPQFAAGYRVQPDIMIYGSIAEGFKAGGWNPASPVGSEAYDEEHAWHLEGGVKGTLASGRIYASAAAFNIDWSDLQFNAANTLIPGQFYIANVGEATSRGVEFEVAARPHETTLIFGNLGVTRARFGDGAISSGVDVSDNRVPNTPSYTAAFGANVEAPVTDAVRLFGRAEAVFYGEMEFDDANTARQDAYSLVNLRGGVRTRYFFADAWMKNAFDSRYVAVAFPYIGFAPSGFLAELGRPRTFGVSAGVTF